MSDAALKQCIDVLRRRRAAEGDLLKCMRDLRDAGRGAAVAVPDLVNILEDESRQPFLRVTAAETLAAMGRDGEPAVPALIRIIKSTLTGQPTPLSPASWQDLEDLRVQAVKTLSDIGVAPQEVILTLADAAQNPTNSSPLRRESLDALRDFRERSVGATQHPATAEHAVAILIRMLQQPGLDPELKLKATKALAAFGFHARGALGYLASRLREPGEREDLYAENVRAFERIAVELQSRSALVDQPELKKLIAELGEGTRALDRRGSREFDVPRAAAQAAMSRLQADVRLEISAPNEAPTPIGRKVIWITVFVVALIVAVSIGWWLVVRRTRRRTPSGPVLPPQASRKIFISYAHKDAKWLDRVLEHLKPLEDELAIFSDRDVEMGTEWHKAIRAQLESAQAAVLLVSPAFLASDYIRDHEMPVLLEKNKRKAALIIPVILRRCLFARKKYKFPDPASGPEEFSLTTLQAANDPGKPLSGMKIREQDEVFLGVAQRLLQHLGRKP